MITDPQIREQAYQYFLEEAPGLLETFEQYLFALNEQDRAIQVNNLMRAAHTIKGGAANVGLDTITTIAHELEDIVKGLYNPELKLDSQIHELLFQAYECLRLPLMAQFTQGEINEEEILSQAKIIFAQLRSKLGDYINQEDAFPSAEALGIDVIESFFEVVIPERLQEIKQTLEKADINEIAQVLQQQSDILLALGESLNLPGLISIARTTLKALEIHPEQALLIAQTILDDLHQAQQDVLAGDRTQGGNPSPILQQLAYPSFTDISSFLSSQPNPQTIDIETPSVETISEFNFEPNLFDYSLEETLEIPEIESYPLVNYLAAFSLFLQQNPNYNSETSSQIYLQTIKVILAWLSQEQNHPLESLNFNSLIPTTEHLSNPSEAEIRNYIDGWLYPFLKYLKQETDSPSLRLYRYWIILETLIALAKFLDLTDKNNPVILVIDSRKDKIYHAYKNYPPISQQEEKWLQNEKIQHLITNLELALFPSSNHLTSESAIELVDEIWGEELTSESLTTVIKDAEIVSETPPEIKPKIPNIAVEKPSEFIQKTQADKAKTAASQMVRINVKGLERLNYLLGEILINQNKSHLLDQQSQTTINELLEQINKHQQIVNNLAEWLGEDLLINQNQLEENISLETTILLEQLSPQVNLILESVNQAHIIGEKVKNLTKESSQSLHKQKRMLLQMRDELLEIRMAKLETILNRFPPLLEQLSNRYHKEVELKLTGHHILVDKAISEKLYDPLLHLVRNAFDHGLESPEERQQSGKPPIGTIEIRAYHQGSQTVIEVRDDGQGLNFEKIRKKAIDLKFITPEIASQIPESKLLELLFEPRFSTANKVSDLSGRGVGLDVVRTQIEALKGTIAIESRPQQGTIFSLQIPLTLSISKLMVCEAGGTIYALLPDVIEKIILPKENELKIFDGQKVFYWKIANNNYSIPVRNLSDLIKYQRHSTRNFKNIHPNPSQVTIINPILLLRRDNNLIGIEVDKVLGEQELVIRPLGSAFIPPNYIYGCSILSNSQLTLVIDAISLVEKITDKPISKATEKTYLTSRSQGLLSSQNIPTLPPEKSAQVLLVVDDSLTQRKTISMTLEKAGYQVIQASDGIEALEKLKESNIDLVVCDLEMPRMNGLELLKNVRKQSDIKEQAPIVMLTSRQEDYYQNVAKQLGAAAYLAKPCNESELLTTILRLQHQPHP